MGTMLPRAVMQRYDPNLSAHGCVNHCSGKCWLVTPAVNGEKTLASEQFQRAGSKDQATRLRVRLAKLTKYRRSRLMRRDWSRMARTMSPSVAGTGCGKWRMRKPRNKPHLRFKAS